MEHAQPQEQRSPNPVTRKLLAAIAGGALLLAAGCSSSETEATPRPEVSVASEHTTPMPEVTTPVVVEGDGDPSNDKDSANMAQYYAENLKMEDSDEMQARIDDPTVAAESRLAVDHEEADWAQYYAENLKMEDSDEMQARIDDPTVAAESRLAVDHEEADWAQYYKDNGRTQDAQAMQDRIGK